MLALNTNSSETIGLQYTFSVSHTDDSFTTVVSNSHCVPSENPIAAVLGYFRIFPFFCIENGKLCVLIRIASTRRF